MELGQRAKFVFVAAGIFICYFYYGILQVPVDFTYSYATCIAVFARY
jgi:hypothetical protein